jgi:hypothetical protein
MSPAAEGRFRLRADAMAAVAARMNRRFVLTALSAFALLVALAAGMVRGGDTGPRTLVFGLLLLLALVAVTYRRRVRRFRARWASFEITLEPEAISRTVEGHPPVTIARASVTALEEHAAGITVRGAGADALVVPRELERYEAVRTALVAWRRR